jgi:hypothetical protein
VVVVLLVAELPVVPAVVVPAPGAQVTRQMPLQQTCPAQSASSLHEKCWPEPVESSLQPLAARRTNKARAARRTREGYHTPPDCRARQSNTLATMAKTCPGFDVT